MQSLIRWRISSLCSTVRSASSNSKVRRSCFPRYAGTRLPKIVSNSAHFRSISSVAQHNDEQSTIFALSTPSGRSAIAVIRISGPACLDIYRALCPGKADPPSRQAVVRKLYSADQSATSHILDNVAQAATLLDAGALVLYFAAPKTVTGEDVLELHVHGGPAIVQAVLRAVSTCRPLSGVVRFAEPGEFTRRAFWNNKLDLTQVEALGDMLSATTEQQRRLSVRGASATLAKEYDTWRTLLLYARGELEALIDFSEDQHLDDSTSELLASVASQIVALTRILKIHVQNAMRGELLRNGLSISLLGAPNAGKSSLLNTIVNREAAIVSHEAGTTRDIVEVGVDIGGYFCRFGDTAGLRSLDLVGSVEKEGIRRAKLRAADSDVVIVVLDFISDDSGAAVLQMDDEVISTASQLMQDDADKIIVVLNKLDLVKSTAVLENAKTSVKTSIPGLSADRIFAISSIEDNATSSSTQEFLLGLAEHFHHLTIALSTDDQTDQSIWQHSLGATERHRQLIQDCIAALEEFLLLAHNDSAEEDADIVVAAEHLRTAADCLAKITGTAGSGDVEAVLGVVFEKFCVGK